MPLNYTKAYTHALVALTHPYEWFKITWSVLMDVLSQLATAGDSSSGSKLIAMPWAQQSNTKSEVSYQSSWLSLIWPISVPSTMVSIFVQRLTLSIDFDSSRTGIDFGVAARSSEFISNYLWANLPVAQPSTCLCLCRYPSHLRLSLWAETRGNTLSLLWAYEKTISLYLRCILSWKFG